MIILRANGKMGEFTCSGSFGGGGRVEGTRET